MKKKLNTVTLYIVLVVLVMAVSHCTKLIPEEDAVLDAQDKINTFRVHFTFEYNTMPNNLGMWASQKGSGIIELKRKGSVFFDREEKTTKQYTYRGRRLAAVITSKTVDIRDEKYSWNYTYWYAHPAMPGKIASKAKIMDNYYNVPSKAMFKWMNDNNTVTPQPDETVNGKPCTVLKLVPKDTKSQVERILLYYDKETGYKIRERQYLKNGKLLLASDAVKVEVNPEISDDRFVLKPPKGVTIQDNTRGS